MEAEKADNMALKRRELHLIMVEPKLAEKSFVRSLPWAYHLKINDKTMLQIPF